MWNLKKRIVCLSTAMLAMCSSVMVYAGSTDIPAAEELPNSDVKEVTSEIEGVMPSNAGFYSASDVKDLGESEKEQKDIENITNMMGNGSVLPSDLLEGTDAMADTFPAATDVGFYSEIIGSITADAPEQWYSFTTAANTAVTVDLYMENTLDADFYVFQTSDDGGSLELIGGSVNTGLGANELIKGMLDARKYYVYVNAAEGTGAFSMMVYGGTNDQREINDTLDTASSYSNNVSMNGTIDSPYDLDVYKATFAKPQLFKKSFSAPSGYNYSMLLYDGNSFSNLEDDTLYNVPAGTYYFVVSTNNGEQYSNTASYSLKVSCCPKSSDSNIAGYWLSGNWKSLFEFTGDRSKYYINGNEIDFTYSRTFNNSNGNIYVNLNKTSDGVIALFQQEAVAMRGELPDFINYRGPFVGDTSHSNALMLSLGNCYYRVNSFNSDYNSLTSNHAMVVIDNTTGKIVDIIEPNPMHTVIVNWNRIRGTTSSYNADPVD